MKQASSHLFLSLLLCTIFLMSTSVIAVESVPLQKKVEVRSGGVVPDQVKIPLTLTVFEKVVYQDKEGKRARFIPLTPVKLLLKSRLQKAQHFYVKNWHIETRPISYQADTKLYALEVSIAKLHGQESQLENYLGSMKFKGQIKPVQGKQGFLLTGHQETTFKDQWNNPTLKLVLGQGQPDQAGQRPVISKR